MGRLSSDEEVVLFVVDGLPTSKEGVRESVPKSPNEGMLQPQPNPRGRGNGSGLDSGWVDPRDTKVH